MTPRPLGDVWHWREELRDTGCAVFISLGKERTLRFTHYKDVGEVIKYRELVSDGASQWHAPKSTCKVPPL